MSIPILIAACISLLGLIAHTFIGTKETASLCPEVDGSEIGQKQRMRWKQSMCSFQMVTVDLVIVTLALFTISLTDLIPFEYELTLIIGFLFLFWGVAWLAQLFILKSEVATYAALPQWLFFFVCSGLLFWGA